MPGAVDGWFELNQRYGRLPMARVLAPAIQYAREGFPVTELIAYYWNRSVPILSEWPGFAEQMTIDGRAPRKGELWRNPNLADTLETLASTLREKAQIEGKIDALSTVLGKQDPAAVSQAKHPGCRFTGMKHKPG
mgnify:CR=1 FL=1